MKSYRCILLDWDGNLAQTLNVWPDALDVALQRRGIRLERQDLIKACGGVAAFLAEHIGLSEQEGDRVLREATKIVKTGIMDIELYPDAVEVLKELKAKGKKIAVVTSSVRSVIEPLLDKFELRHIFDAVICIEDTNHRKPHAEPLQKALALLGGTEAEAVMAGDTEKDILAGRNAGMDTALFYPAGHEEFYDMDELKLHAPTYVIRDFKQLIDVAG